MDFSKCKAPYIPKEAIWEKADNFRRRYCPDGELPVPILDIAEFDLDITIQSVSDLKSVADVDALFLPYREIIIVDYDHFMDDRMQNRLRFSLAHEIGHLELHAESYPKLTCTEDFFAYYKKVPTEAYFWFEAHANEFAGRVLVPPEILKNEVDAAVESAKGAGFMDWDQSRDEAIQYMSTGICRRFRVSSDVIEKRIRHENLL